MQVLEVSLLLAVVEFVHGWTLTVSFFNNSVLQLGREKR